MFTNLVDNAVKYTSPGGSVEVAAESNESEVVVGVLDTGIGIPKEKLSRIFERFYRVDKARSKKTGGTGLGLSIVRHVAENHGGYVTVESVLGEGSTFTVCLPRDSSLEPS
jgi:signal transduction histidine kinase